MKRHKIENLYFLKNRKSSALRKNSILLLALLLCPILLIAVVDFLVISQQSLTANKIERKIHSESLLDQMERQFEVITKVHDKYQKDSMFISEFQDNPIKSYYHIQRCLKSDALWTTFFDNISYYNLQNGYVISTRGKDSTDFFFKNVYNSYQLTNGKVPVNNDDSRFQTFRVHDALKNENGILFLAPLEFKKNVPVSYLMFTVYDSTLCTMWGNPSRANGYITLFFNGQPIYCSDKRITHDLQTGKAVNSILQKNGNLTFSYKKDAFAVQWNIPKLVLFSGTLKLVIFQSILTFIVLGISMIAALRYSRKAYAPVERILANIPQAYSREGIIDEFKYIDMVLTDLSYSKKFLEETTEELRLEKYLYDILDNQVVPNTQLYRQCLDSGIHVDCQYFACILLSDIEENKELYLKLNTFLEDTKKGTSHDFYLYSLYILDDKYIFLICSNQNKDELLGKLQRIQDASPHEVSVGCVVEGVQNVREAYSSACKKEEFNKKIGTEQEDVYPKVELEALQEAIATSNSDKIQFAIRMLKNRLPECSHISRMATFSMACTLLGQGDYQLISSQLQSVQTTEVSDICILLDKVFEEYAQNVKEAHIMSESLQNSEKGMGYRNLRSVMQYIQNNYQDPNFSIKSMATDFDTSFSNLSHFFKRSTGETLSHFIDELKIKRAEEMLLSGEKVSVVAKELGYSSSSAFIAKFKRIRGETPSAFRSNYNF